MGARAMPATGPPRPLLIAHRGASAVAPEHTIAAYEAAIRAGADALQLDVHLSSDDQLVVIHDDTLERTTSGRGRVRAHSVRELKRLDAGRWFGRGFRGQRIQTLPEVLERFRDLVAFAVELGAGSDVYPGIEERLVGLLQIYAVTDRTHVVSDAPHALARCRALDPDLRLGARLAERPFDQAGVSCRGAFDALWLRADAVTGADVSACRETGLECYVGVVRDAESARRLAAWGVAGIVTDRPDLLRSALDAFAPGA